MKKNKLVQFVARGVVAVGNFVKTHAKPLCLAAFSVAGASLALAVDPDATLIATGASTAFGVIAPITISIAGFYVILNIAKRVVR
jgi:hypothetical protein